MTLRLRGSYSVYGSLQAAASSLPARCQDPHGWWDPKGKWLFVRSGSWVLAGWEGEVRVACRRTPTPTRVGAQGLWRGSVVCVDWERGEEPWWTGRLLFSTLATISRRSRNKLGGRSSGDGPTPVP